MTLTLSNWLTGNLATTKERAILAETRAAAAWRRINDKPESIAFRKPGATSNVAAQTVRIESDTGVTLAESAAGTAATRKVIVFGVRDHATVTDTDMGEGYRFTWSGDSYVIRDIILTIGEIQGLAEATS